MFEQLLNYKEPRQPGEIQAGDVFGRLTATSTWKRRPDHHKLRYCCCSCGEQGWFAEKDLKAENTKSCGCLRREQAVKRLPQARRALASNPPERGGDGRFLPK